MSKRNAMSASSSRLLDATCRVALAGMLHDVGKFAERARIDVAADRLNDHKHHYCPFRQQGGYHSHVHAAYSALVIEDLERGLPDLVGDDVFPFASWGQRGADDSLINAAAKHHNPETFLQWIVATADRAASGLDREEFDQYNQGVDETSQAALNHYTTRQWTLFEQISLRRERPSGKEQKPNWRYPLRQQTPVSIFPLEAQAYESRDREAAQTEYRGLWDDFKQALHQIPLEHAANLPVWLDHFDSLWMIFAQAIPAATFKVAPDVSLYDHSKAVAALSAALWRYHHENDDDPETARKAMQERSDWDTDKFLMVQGDLFGIQDFIFATGGQTQKYAARLLRGRSFYVSLLAECAALTILDALALPPTSQIINAAGKFRIVAPNTERTRQILQKVQCDLDQWCLTHTYGQVGIGLAWEPASCNDLKTGSRQESPYRKLQQRLFEKLEQAKYRRFDLCGETPPPAVFEGYLSDFDNELGPCAIDNCLPAAVRTRDGIAISQLARDQIETGRALTEYEVVAISRKAIPTQGRFLRLPIFGFHVHFDRLERLRTAANGRSDAKDILRQWDFALAPRASGASLWNGWAKRYVNGFVPRFADPEEEGAPSQGFKDLSALADAALLKQDGKSRGAAALMTVKGDVDNLGAIFQQGLEAASFSREAALSRQMNAFFALYLPWLCQTEYPETYTVFAGGDDFFLIGPWRQQLQLAERMKDEFHRYVAGNPDIHFSVGLIMTKPGVPIRYLAEQGEEALDEAKAYSSEAGEKNAVRCFERTVDWKRFSALMQTWQTLQSDECIAALSTGYLYGLLGLMDMRENMHKRPQDARWRALFVTRTQRMLERLQDLNSEQRQERYNAIVRILLGDGIDRYGSDFRIALVPALYSRREVTRS